MFFSRCTTRATSLVAALAAVVAHPGAAQDSPSYFPPVSRLVAPAPQLPSLFAGAPRTVPQAHPLGPDDDLGGPVMGGILGALVGAFLGGFLAPKNPEGDYFPDLFSGAAVGVVLAVPVGVNLMDRGGGELGAALAGSFAGGMVALAAGQMMDGGELVFAVPLASIVGAVVGEVKSRPR